MRLVHSNDAHGTGCVQTMHRAFCALTGRLKPVYAKVDKTQLRSVQIAQADVTWVKQQRTTESMPK